MESHRCQCGETAPVRYQGLFSRCVLCGRLKDRRWSRATTFVVFALGLTWLGALMLTLFSAA